MAHSLKIDQNTPIHEIDTINNPNTKTLIDRYVFASNWCKGKHVLDAASGHCYGGLILNALGANSVVCGDIDNEALDNAHTRYRSPQMQFLHNLDLGKPFPDYFTDNFDVIVSIETFEHVPKESVNQMLNNFKLACKYKGTIIISTPQRFIPEFKYVEGSTHLYEYNINEFYQELSRVFNNIELWYAVEFRHPASNELNTVFTKNPEWSDKAAVMVAVITND